MVNIFNCFQAQLLGEVGQEACLFGGTLEVEGNEHFYLLNARAAKLELLMTGVYLL